MTETRSNTRIWDALGKTDPAHTKSFSRSGGFKGTAIKPIWCDRRMTEYFGPCGIGWGPDKPEFATHIVEGEALVFCWVGLWYIEPGTGERGQVYGVGGDKFVIKQSNGTRTSDEAYKASYTDALGNAMKLIGVAADVHMGLFDDSKYVRDVGEEFKSAKAAPAAPPPAAPAPLVTDAEVTLIDGHIAQMKDLASLNAVMTRYKPELLAMREKMPDSYQRLVAAASARKTELTPKEG